MSTGVEIKGLKKSFGDNLIFDGFYLSFSPGGSYAIMGRSGLGKTTLLKIIMGLLKADGGDIIFTDETGKKLLRKPEFAVVFQEDRLCEYLSARENISMCMRGFSEDPSVVRELSRVLSEDSLNRPVRELSGGQKRRVAIVRAMMRTDADIIIMDEPFTGMDEDTKRTVADCINWGKQKRLLIISVHSREEAKLLNAEITDMGSLIDHS